MAAYQDIINMVTSLLNNRQASASQVQAWIQNGIQRIQRELRGPLMEKRSTVTIPANYQNLPIPTDLIELIDLINSQGDRVTKKDITTVNQLAGLGTSLSPVQIDFPQFYYRKTNFWLLGPTPAQGDTVEIVYYAELSPLINPTDTNVLTLIAPDLLWYAALTFAGDFFVDRRSDKWEQRYQQILGQLQSQADEDELSGGAAVTPAFFYPQPLDGGELYAEQYSIYP